MIQALPSWEQGLALLAAHLLGAIPFGLVFGLAKGVDLRQAGSGNIGAANAMRVLGKPIGVAVFLLDALKGFLPAWAALRAWPHVPQGPAWALGLGAAAVLGHSFPAWLKFKGGKGVATGCGVWLAVAPLPCLAALGVFGLTLAATRYVSLASVMGAFSLPLMIRVFGTRPGWLVAWALGMAALIAIKHRANFTRMAAGVEPRIGGTR